MKCLSAGLLTMAMLAATSASADVLCSNADQSVKIQTFQLSEDTFGFDPVKVAAILKLSGPKVLYTGTEQNLPTRTGNIDVFNLVDEQGVAIDFMTTKTFIYNQCTRVSCNPILKIVGKLEVAGVSHSLTCSSPIF